MNKIINANCSQVNHYLCIFDYDRGPLTTIKNDELTYLLVKNSVISKQALVNYNEFNKGTIRFIIAGIILETI